MKDSYLTPLAPDVALAVDQLDESAREQFEERAAILEFHAGMARCEAERRALGTVLSQHAGDSRAGDNPAMD